MCMRPILKNSHKNKDNLKPELQIAALQLFSKALCNMAIHTFNFALFRHWLLTPNNSSNNHMQQQQQQHQTQYVSNTTYMDSLKYVSSNFNIKHMCLISLPNFWNDDLLQTLFANLGRIYIKTQKIKYNKLDDDGKDDMVYEWRKIGRQIPIVAEMMDEVINELCNDE